MIKVLVSDKLSEEGVKILQDAGFSVDCKYKLSPQELKQWRAYTKKQSHIISFK